MNPWRIMNVARVPKTLRHYAPGARAHSKGLVQPSALVAIGRPKRCSNLLAGCFLNPDGFVEVNL